MAQFLGFGNGGDGSKTYSVNATDAPIVQSATGTSGSADVAVTSGAAFTVGQIVLLMKMRGNTTTPAGTYELAKIASIASNTLTMERVLVNTFNDDGAVNQSICQVIPQYDGVVTFNSGVKITVKAWDGNVGGVFAIMTNNKIKFNSADNLYGVGQNGKDLGGTPIQTTDEGGYRGGFMIESNSGTAGAGEGTAGVRSTSPTGQNTANGNGGGGGAGTGGQAGGGGGGNGSAGNPGSTTAGGATAGAAGSTAGEDDLDTMTMGGSGGGAIGGSGTEQGSGGNGGAIVMLFARIIEPVAGCINVSGGRGGNGSGFAGGGGGAGGSVKAIAEEIRDTVTNWIIAAGGAAGAGTNAPGGAGGTGRVSLQACTITGTTNPTNATPVGAYDWCAVTNAIL